MPNNILNDILEADERYAASTEETHKFLEEYAKDKLKQSKIESYFLEAFRKAEENDKRVAYVVTNAKIFNIIRKNLGDFFDANTVKKLLQLGYFGMLWGAQVFVKKDFDDLLCLSEDDPRFKELFPEVAKLMDWSMRDTYCPAGKINCHHSYVNDSGDKCCNPNHTELPVGIGVVVGPTGGFPADEVCRWPSKILQVTQNTI